MTTIELEPVDRIRMTILMDNVTDPLLTDQDGVARLNWPKALLGALPRTAARTRPDDGVPDALIAARFPQAFVQYAVGTTIEL
jgi:hypothetical protein